MQQDEGCKDDCDSDRVAHENDAVIQNCEEAESDPCNASLNDPSPPSPAKAHTSNRVDEAFGLSSPLSIINTSGDSVIHHSDILTPDVQTEPSVTLKDEENTVFKDSENFINDQLAEGYERTIHECENQNESSEHSSQPSTDVSGPVVSSQVATQSLSPSNSVSLEQEKQVTHETEISCPDDEQSHPIGSRSVDGQSVGEEGTVNEVADRNLERFSEILLDSDLSQSDSEAQNDSSKIVSPDKSNKSAKRVRFSDKVELKEHG